MPEPKKLSDRAIGLMAFAPWILYGVSSGFNHWRMAAGGGLILCLMYLAVMRRRGSSIKLMDWTPLAFFVIASVLTIALQAAIWFPTYNAVVVWSSFAAAAWGSVLIGRPFTAAYARETAPPEFWSNPIFIRLNLIMTLVWCGLMTRQRRHRCDRCRRRRSPRPGGARIWAADGRVDLRIRLQQSFPRQVSGAVRLSDTRDECASLHRVASRQPGYSA